MATRRPPWTTPRELVCRSSVSSGAGTDFARGIGAGQARALLKEAGYKNEKVVFLHAASSALLNPIGLVMADQMKRAGFNIDVFTTDYATAAQRRRSRPD